MTKHETEITPSTTREYYDQFIEQWDSRRFDARTIERLTLTLPMMLPSGSVLVVGIGGGAEPRLLRDRGYDVTVIDVSGVGIRYARELGFRAFEVNVESDPIPGQYHQVVCMEVLEHLRDPLAALKKLQSALKPGGQLFVGLPNEFHVVRRLRVLAGAMDFARYDWPHLRFFTLKECRRLFHDAELETRQWAAAPLVPPRMWLLRALGKVLCRLWPGLFAVSFVFHLRPQPA